ncbi:response regulator transcription factor [Brachybacterium sacelli]|uniref:DNA-binding NarL/FixJ family response regulator n=1 Tax=Brachybacterium sacelli TaxID=173364 RepID=A0ABS4X3Z7_9MICO|nr:response regulator transcription factor [Brachybacterium sacelli]MBP2383051.1 DNA-binding NarL/FixJ family response regulator [Brachybacterium sacelli]
MPTVLICNDDPVVRESLSVTLGQAEDLRVLAAVETADEALQVVATAAPDVALMDLALPGTHGLEATRRMRAHHPATAMVVLTAFGTDVQVRAAIAAGAAGILLKSTGPDALVAAVRAAGAAAGTVIAPELAVQLANGPRAGTPAQPAPGTELGPSVMPLHLTSREAEVLSLLCAARSNAAIAQALSLSESTVKSHVSSLMDKLECSSRLQVVLRAFERGLIPPPSPSSAA